MKKNWKCFLGFHDNQIIFRISGRAPIINNITGTPCHTTPVEAIFKKCNRCGSVYAYLTDGKGTVESFDPPFLARDMIKKFPTKCADNKFINDLAKKD
jgi:hypothetical protein